MDELQDIVTVLVGFTSQTQANVPFNRDSELRASAGNVILMFGFYCINFYTYHLFMVNEAGFHLIATHNI